MLTFLNFYETLKICQSVSSEYHITVNRKYNKNLKSEITLCPKIY